MKCVTLTICLYFLCVILPARPVHSADQSISTIEASANKFIKQLLDNSLTEYVDSIHQSPDPDNVKRYITAERLHVIITTSNVRPSIVVSQSAIETMWGLRVKANNYFGIKGSKFTYKTVEYINNQRYVLNQTFAGYDSFEQSVAAHSKLLTGHIYNIDIDMSVTSSVNALRDNTYATDPCYSTKIHYVINRYSLSKLDTIKAEYDDLRSLLNTSK